MIFVSGKFEGEAHVTNCSCSINQGVVAGV